MSSGPSSLRDSRHEASFTSFWVNTTWNAVCRTRADDNLNRARSIAEQIGPQSDIMTEVKRRFAQLYLLQEDWPRARQEALECIRLSKKDPRQTRDGRGAPDSRRGVRKTRISQKSREAFEAGINTLKSIGECYELMRTCIAYSAVSGRREEPGRGGVPARGKAALQETRDLRSSGANTVAVEQARPQLRQLRIGYHESENGWRISATLSRNVTARRFNRRSVTGTRPSRSRFSRRAWNPPRSSSRSGRSTKKPGFRWKS